jgi:hypothetical protein
MSGLFRRLSSRRTAGPDGVEPAAQAEPGTANAPTDAPAEPGGHESLLTDPAAPTRILRDGEQPPADDATRVMPQSETATGPAPAQRPLGELAPVMPAAPAQPPALPVSDLPAGLDPDELAAAPPSSARRGRLRRRVSFLRAAREVLLRDLGGFAYEIHRTAGDIEHEAHRRLREIKLTRLSRLDAELHALELQLDDVRRHVVVREPGVGGECPQCGELFGSDANYCAHCGVPLTEAARKAVAREAAEAAAAPPPPPAQPAGEVAPAESEFAWPRRTEPAAAGEDAQAAAGEAAAGDDAPTASGEPVAAAEDAPTASDKPVAAGDDAPTATDEAAGEDVTLGDKPAAGDDEPAPAPGDETAAGDEATAAAPDGDAEADAAGPAGGGAPGSPDAEGRNGRQDTAYRTVERPA